MLAATGYLITPEFTVSYDEMALGRYTHINAFLNASQLCAAVDAVMASPFVVSWTELTPGVCSWELHATCIWLLAAVAL